MWGENHHRGHRRAHQPLDALATHPDALTRQHRMHARAAVAPTAAWIRRMRSVSHASVSSRSEGARRDHAKYPDSDTPSSSHIRETGKAQWARSAEICR
jgi:hypothetical protein